MPQISTIFLISFKLEIKGKLSECLETKLISGKQNSQNDFPIQFIYSESHSHQYSSNSRELQKPTWVTLSSHLQGLHDFRRNCDFRKKLDLPLHCLLDNAFILETLSISSRTEGSQTTQSSGNYIKQSLSKPLTFAQKENHYPNCHQLNLLITRGPHQRR